MFELINLFQWLAVNFLILIDLLVRLDIDFKTGSQLFLQIELLNLLGTFYVLRLDTFRGMLEIFDPIENSRAQLTELLWV